MSFDLDDVFNLEDGFNIFLFIFYVIIIPTLALNVILNFFSLQDEIYGVMTTLSILLAVILSGWLWGIEDWDSDAFFSLLFLFFLSALVTFFTLIAIFNIFSLEGVIYGVALTLYISGWFVVFLILLFSGKKHPAKIIFCVLGIIIIIGYVVLLTLNYISSSKILNISVNGEIVQFDQSPIIVEGILLAPFEPIAEIIDAETRWNSETQTITIIYKNRRVALQIENPTMSVVDFSIEDYSYSPQEFYTSLPAPPQMYNGEAYMPIETIATELRLSVKWDDMSNTKYIANTEYGIDDQSGISWIYVGDFKNEYKHGQGKMTWDNGDEYNGAFENGYRHGFGRMIYVNGDTYNGYWNQGYKHGRGTMRWVNGDIYRGDWEDGYQHGTGTFTYSNGTVLEGTWHRGEFQ